MGVDFVTSAGSAGLSVRYGTSPGALTQVVDALTTPFTGNGWSASMNAAIMTGLTPNTAYFYSVGSSSENWSAPVSFTNAQTLRPSIVAVYADFGIGNDISMSTIVAVC